MKQLSSQHRSQVADNCHLCIHSSQPVSTSLYTAVGANREPIFYDIHNNNVNSGSILLLPYEVLT